MTPLTSTTSTERGPAVASGVPGVVRWTPLTVSLVLHATLLVALSAVALRVAPAPEPPPAPEITLSFEAPALTGRSARPTTPASGSGFAAGSGAGQGHDPALAAPVPEAPVATALEGLAADLPDAAPPQSALPAVTASLDRAGSGLGDVRFGGLASAGARTVVYVVDGSGPMVSSFPWVAAELVRSVGRLSPSQRFAVVVFGDLLAENTRPELFRPGFTTVSPAARRALASWLGTVRPRGRSNPLSGLRLAVALKPDAIFLLSCGIARSEGGQWGAGLEATLAEIDRLNPVDPRTGRRRIAIKTIQFLDEDPTGIMRAIGERHGATRGDPGFTLIGRASLSGGER